MSSKINDNFRYHHIYSNLWFHSNMILFCLFGNYLVTTMILVTMIPSIHKYVYYQFVLLFSLYFKLLLLVHIFVSFLDEQNSWILWQARCIIDTDYLSNTWKYYKLLPKTYRIYCFLIDEYIQFLTIISIMTSFLVNLLIILAYL